jgi:putative tryptophan/tyrosine transport system substrate-binding protein
MSAFDPKRTWRALREPLPVSEFNRVRCVVLAVGAKMRRREFVYLFGGVIAVTPLAAWAQESKRTYRIGVITLLPRMAINYVAFFDELQKLGFVEGQNLIVDARGFAARSEQFSELALALVDSHVDALVCGGDLAIRAAQQVTQIIPVVGITDDMLSAGLVHSLAKPGGNTTGISILATELDGKRLEILSELVPHAPAHCSTYRLQRNARKCST